MSDDAIESEIPEVKVRALLIDEDEAINGYLAVKGTDPELDKIIDDIIMEENEHKGQLQAWLDKQNPKTAEAMAEGLREGEEQMTKEQAWRDFKNFKKSVIRKAQYPNQVSISDKLDSIEAKLSDMQTSVERLDEVVPELAGDMSAIENEENDMEELSMPEEVDGLLYSDVTDEASGMEGQDTNEASTEGSVDTVPSETASLDEDLDIGSGKPEKDEVGGEDVDDSTEQLEGEVGDVDTEIKVSKANFDYLVKVMKIQKQRLDTQEKTIRLLKTQVANMRNTGSRVIQPAHKTAPGAGRVIPKATPPSGMPVSRNPNGIAKNANVRPIVNTRPTGKAGYRPTADPADLRKSIETPTEPIKIGMGTNSDDVARNLAKRIDAMASAGRTGL